VAEPDDFLEDGIVFEAASALDPPVICSADRSSALRLHIRTAFSSAATRRSSCAKVIAILGQLCSDHQPNASLVQLSSKRTHQRDMFKRGAEHAVAVASS
jgi:hypothetical protein